MTCSESAYNTAVNECVWNTRGSRRTAAAAPRQPYRRNGYRAASVMPSPSPSPNERSFALTKIIIIILYNNDIVSERETPEIRVRAEIATSCDRPRTVGPP